ncbi:MAG: metal ABC transporter ATP-binding protein [Alphaproteobacteria bacterium]
MNNQPDKTQPWAITANKVSLQRGGRKIVDSISLKITRGQTLVLIGPNGAGKTSLLRLLVKIEQPTQGTIKHAKGITIGYMPQNLERPLRLPITAERFLALYQRTTPLTPPTPPDSTPIREHLKRADIRKETQIANLSSGEWQRLLLARALLRQPDILALDEPDQNLDLAGRAAFYRHLDDLRNEGGYGIVLVSHALSLVMARADHILCLNGHLCCSGSPATVMQDPAYLELFGAHTDDALIPWPHHHDHVH